MIAVSRLSKQIRGQCILSDISFVINPGERIGILGPNGAGKTTLLKIICGLVYPSGGSIILDGIKNRDIAAFFNEHHFLHHLSAAKNVSLFRRSLALPEKNIRSSLKQKPVYQSGVKYTRYSSGMQKQLNLFSIFDLGKSIYLLDEPSNFLDIDNLLDFEYLITNDNDKDSCYVISSHDSLALENLCTRILVLKNGQLVHDGSIKWITDNYGSLKEFYKIKIPDY